MQKNTLSQAIEQAAAGSKPSAELSGSEFEAFLAGIAQSVIRNILAVRSGALKPDEAAEADDATVRTLAQILMGEHERIRLALSGDAPRPGPELLRAMEARDPELFLRLEPGADRANPRSLAVHASRAYLSGIYAMIRAAASEGEALTEAALRARIEALSALWMHRFGFGTEA